MSHALFRSAARRLAPRAPVGAQRRFLATEETPVSWAEYRSGEKTLQQWVEANRHKVAGGMFAFYVSLAAWNLRPKKKKKGAEEAAGSQ